MRRAILIAAAARWRRSRRRRTSPWPSGTLTYRRYPSVPGAEIAPIRLQNSSRLDGLIRAGNLYLTIADALALAIENNLNLEINRYGPLQWPIPHVESRQGRRSDSRRPVRNRADLQRGRRSGRQWNSIVSAGLWVAAAAAVAAARASGGATIQQVGVVVPNFDPTVQNTTNFSHLTTPEANTHPGPDEFAGAVRAHLQQHCTARAF